MSEVSKRDAQFKAINKLAAFAANMGDETTIADITVRKRELESGWERYKTLHDLVMDRAGASEKETQEKIADDVYDIYLSTSVKFADKLELLQSSIAVQVSPKAALSQPQQTSQRQRYRAIGRLIERLENKATERIEKIDSVLAAPQLKKLEDLHNQYQALVLEALANCSEVESDLIMENQDVVCDSYFRTSALLQGVINKGHQTEQATQRNINDEVKVPAVQISTFDGTASKWESFRDSFETVFHLRQSMPPVQKLQHLKSCLTGEAEELVANFSLTNENYESAWKLLKQRYDNPYELARAHLRMITSMHTCKENATDIRRLLNRTSSALLALKNLGRPVQHWDDWIVLTVSERLDSETRKLWEQMHCSGRKFPTWVQLEKFIEHRVRALSAICAINNSSSPQPRRVRSHALTGQSHGSPPPTICPACSEAHAIYMCHTFRRMAPEQRRQLVADKRLCFNCLSAAHLSTQCVRDKPCRFCDDQHNSLLHMDTTQLTNSNTMIGPNSSTVLLATAIVRVNSSSGETHHLRAFLDNGSQSSFISEYAAQLLNLPRRTTDFEMVGIGDTLCGHPNKAVTLNVMSRFNDFSVPVEALILRRVTRPCSLPEKCNPIWSHLNGINLADPEYQHPNRIDILLGSDIYGWTLLPGLRKADLDSPIAQNTQFGWIVSGSTRVPINQSISSPTTSANHVSIINNHIEECLEKFWTIEDCGLPRVKTIEEEKCETYFRSTYVRDSTGRFHVRIPFRNNIPIIGNSIKTAIQRQHQMERKFTKNESFATQYKSFMDQYLSLGHMKFIGHISPTTDVHNSTHYYIPHHAIVKESSSTTKLRVVFDASRPSSNGLSLNEQMLSGPKLQDDLSAIILRWRKHKIVFTADVERMYRQIIVDEPDSSYQRIVWRKSVSDPMQIYELTTVTYGTTSAPYLAIKSLQTLAEEERMHYPIASKIAKEDFYVDDVLTGFDDVSTALICQEQLRTMMSSGGFELKKWTSNSNELLHHLPEGFCECRLPLNFNLDQQVKTLGMQWSPVTDRLSFNISLDIDTISVTKRQFLSDAASLYDPLGWLSPCVILVKIMFQHLWQLKLNWDEQLPDSIAQNWFNLRQNFKTLGNLQINRWIGSYSHSSIELHGFCDSSIHAYAAAVYVRVTSLDGITSVELLCAKTKVAPLKTLSLPRLELCGAVLLCRLMENVKVAMKFENVETFCWTDSTIVLSWIRGSPSRWSVFVANRVAELQRNLPTRDWHHISSEDNPADCASRGLSPAMLPSHSLWWTGPYWLRQPCNHWPMQSQIPETTEEMKSKAVVSNSTVTPSWNLKDKYSSWYRLIRITAHCLRFINNVQGKARTTGPLYPKELQAAKLVWLKDEQQCHFAAELRCLRNGQPIDHKSSLRSLNPTLHADGLIHVGGRLLNAIILPEQSKCPIIIPRRCHLAELIVRHAHEHTLHGGPSLMLSHIRRQFWIIDGPKHVRQFVKRCNKCFRYSSTLGQQMMGVLPTARITPSRPFAHTAMDYSGAVMLRSARGRGQHATKGYISVFVCLCTKAVHIEVVSDLTSAAFIAAYKRFTGRRGICSDLYSDNATNYVGASAIFNKTERDLGYNTDMLSNLAMMGTTWHFSPPVAPHFNGLAEAAIRSIKHHIRRVVGESTLTFEEMTTFLIQVECCLNSRPLYPLSSDPSDYSALTPAHFLIGTALNAVPENNLLNTKSSALNRWQLMQQMIQRFWVQWSAEYLHTLQQRKKWQMQTPNFVKGDLVLVADDNQPPSSWLLGRIIEAHPGSDGKVRVVTLRTASQTMKRSIVKLARLPTQEI